ncbi:MAG: hypothetical protein ACE364_12570 [Chlorobiota bacterium]
MKTINLLLLILIVLTSCSDDKSTEPNNKFCSEINIMPQGLEGTYTRIVGVLPNPEGDDDYTEQFKIRSFLLNSTDLSEYYIHDDENVRWNLSELEFYVDYEGEDFCRTLTYISDKVAQLLNSGDKIYLYDKNNIKIQSVSFGPSASGEWMSVYKATVTPAE